MVHRFRVSCYQREHDLWGLFLRPCLEGKQFDNFQIQPQGKRSGSKTWLRVGRPCLERISSCEHYGTFYDEFTIFFHFVAMVIGSSNGQSLPLDAAIANLFFELYKLKSRDRALFKRQFASNIKFQRREPICTFMILAKTLVLCCTRL